MTPLECAIGYYQRGWTPVEVAFRSKRAFGGGWTERRYETVDDLKQFFNGKPQNIGVLLGDASQWLIDVDLDCQEAVRLAPVFLPTTPLVFGRKTRPRSHWLYYAVGASTAKFNDAFGLDHKPLPKEAKPKSLVELRSTGGQTVFPGSTHESGEAVAFDGDESAEPAKIDASDLRAAVARLGAACLLVRHGWRDNDACAAVRGEWPSAQRLLGQESFDEAARRYDAANAREWPRSNGKCPMCGHNECFGRLPDAPSRWVCFSSSHTTPGLQLKNGAGHQGDVLDVDAFAAGLTRADLLKRDGYLSGPVEATARSWLGLKSDSSTKSAAATAAAQAPKPQIILSTDIESVTDEGLAALGQSGAEVFHRAGLLVHMVADESHSGGVARAVGTPRLAAISPARLREALNSSAEWKKAARGDDLAPAMVPTWVVDTAIGRGRWPMLRRIAGIIETPVVKPDGSVLQAPGYDADTGLLHRPNIEARGAGAPTQFDAISAKNDLLDAVADFPLASDAYRSSWLACLLTPFARYAFEGPAPLFLVDANTRGSGKSLLADVVGHICLGRPLPRMSPSDDEPEERKRLTSIAISGDRMVLIDNVSRRLGTSALEAALTSTWWRDRVMGSNQMFEGEMRTVFLATGNNVELSADMTRRVCHIRLESPLETPELREDFRRPDILAWVKTNRAHLVVCCLTILRAYCAAGQPRQKVKPWGSYEGWNRLISHSLVWAGAVDPNDARQELIDSADHERLSILAFLRAFRDYATWGSTVSDMLEDIEKSPDFHAKLLSSLVAICPPQRGNKIPSAVSVGNKLKKFKGRVIGGLSLETLADKTSAGLRWVIRSAPIYAGDAGDAVASHTRARE